MTQSNLEKTGAVVLDARGAARFKGEVKEPREGVRCGHIPESLNLPFQNLLKEDGSGLLETNDLQDQFDNLLPKSSTDKVKGQVLIRLAKKLGKDEKTIFEIKKAQIKNTFFFFFYFGLFLFSFFSFIIQVIVFLLFTDLAQNALSNSLVFRNS
jgi:hypothetical protein